MTRPPPLTLRRGDGFEIYWSISPHGVSFSLLSSIRPQEEELYTTSLHIACACVCVCVCVHSPQTLKYLRWQIEEVADTESAHKQEKGIIVRRRPPARRLS